MVRPENPDDGRAAEIVQPDCPVIRIVRLPHAEGLDLPGYETGHAAGMDLRAACPDGLMIDPGQRHLVPTGLVMEIPAGYEGQVRPRSGLAMRHGITCLNTPGTIDADYRGEIKVLLVNLGDQPFRVERGMRIAQIVFARVARAVLAEAGELSGSARGQGGFGSTGL